MDTNEEFRRIGPYEGSDFTQAIQRLRQNPQLLSNFTDIISIKSRNPEYVRANKDKSQLDGLLSQVHNYTEFQEKITCDFFLDMIEKSSMNTFSFDGIEELENRPHVYISTHRDIVLDTAMLDFALYKSGRPMCEMIIGDNLLIDRFSSDMFKVNGAITVRRNLTSATELRNETLLLSRYIRHVLKEKKKSVWVAQKSGRAKDGKDDTSAAIVKMLYLAYREDGISFEDFLQEASIVPVAMSYEYDPCAVTKGQQVIKAQKSDGYTPAYVKKKNGDLIDIVRGLRMYKGNVHIQFGKEVVSSVNNARDLVREIDRQIHLNYRLWDTNYFCYDFVEGKDDFKDNYQDFDGSEFLGRYRNLMPEIYDCLLNSYANPVRAMLNEKS